MVRTVVSLEIEDKAWLDRRAREEQTSMAELMRRAIRRFRREKERDPASLAEPSPKGVIPVFDVAPDATPITPEMVRRALEE